MKEIQCTLLDSSINVILRISCVTSVVISPLIDITFFENISALNYSIKKIDMEFS